jgi:hypothetical protein
MPRAESCLIIMVLGKIYQTLDANKLQARNEDCFRPIPFLPTVMRAVTAELTPTSKSNVTVQFKQFEFGPFKVKAPESARGALDTTYLDSTFRISRGMQQLLVVVLVVQEIAPGTMLALLISHFP